MKILWTKCVRKNNQIPKLVYILIMTMRNYKTPLKVVSGGSNTVIQ